MPDFERAIVEVLYEEGEPETYRGVLVTLAPAGPPTVESPASLLLYATDDPQADWAQMVEEVGALVAFVECAPSVEQYVRDGGTLIAPATVELPEQRLLRRAVSWLIEHEELDEHLAECAECREELLAELWRGLNPYTVVAAA